MIKLDSVLRIKFKATIQCTLKSSPPPPQNMLPVVLPYSIVECRIEFFANPTSDPLFFFGGFLLLSLAFFFFFSSSSSSALAKISQSWYSAIYASCPASDVSSKRLRLHVCGFYIDSQESCLLPSPPPPLPHPRNQSQAPASSATYTSFPTN